MDSQERLAVPVVVPAAAEIDASNAAQLRAALAAADGRGPTVVLDMSQTVFCDSTGISVLVQAYHRAKAAGGEMRLVVTGAAVLRILALTGIDHLFPVFTSLPDALAGRPGPPATPEPVGTP